MIEKFDVFLCHNSQDKPKVEQIGQELKKWGLTPWLDKWELRPGLSWQEQLEKQIEEIGCAAVFVGSSGLGPWQTQELYAFLREFARRKCPVIPVLLSSAPKQPKLPILLKGNHWVDFRQQKEEAMGQLIWGITGIRPADQKPVIQAQPPEDDLSSEKGVDYTRLRDFLKAQNWRAADEETLKVMLQAANRQKEDWLNNESIENFPCTDLRTIDQLWVKYSNGHFGFSVQRRIWLNSGGKVDHETEKALGDAVGWRKNDSWLGYKDITLTLNAPEGHLPGVVFRLFSCFRGWVLFSRVSHCKV